MNSKHLTIGDECPALIPGSLRIYSMRFCPYAQRANLVAEAKGIKHDIVNINLLKRPEFIFLKNPDGKVPIIETNDGKVLYESLVVSYYMDEAYDNNQLDKSAGDSNPVRKLAHTHPYSRASDRLLLEKFTKVSDLDYQIYLPTTLESHQVISLIEQLNDRLMTFDKELQRRATPFFSSSDKPGILDYMIWPWFERFPTLDLIHANNSALLKQGRESRSRLTLWEKAMMEDRAVKVSYLAPEIHLKYRKMRRLGGKVNYDFLHEK